MRSPGGSAHRTPDDLARYAKTAHRRGLSVIIAGAGSAAHLPALVASHTPLPVIGGPVESKSLKGLDSRLPLLQMPGGIPVATLAIGGARPAGRLAFSLLASTDPALQAKRIAFQRNLAADSRRRGRVPRATRAAKNRPSAKTWDGRRRRPRPPRSRPRESAPPSVGRIFPPTEIPFEFPRVSALMPPCR